MDPTSPPTRFKNRKAGLVIFGILTILGGCVCALFALLAAVSPMIAAHSSNPPPTRPSTLPALAMYAAVAIVFVWLGIGSIMARRWARALLAVISWTLFISGISMLIILITMAPQLKQTVAAAHPANQAPVSASIQSGVMIAMFGFFALFNIVGPLIWALFYSGRNVKATCEALDPFPRWTDRCPLPVLAIALWLFFGAIVMLAMAAVYPIAPFFGMLISGSPARGYQICLCLLSIYASWAMYRLDRRGWWVVSIVMIASIVSGLITFSRHDITEVYGLVGYSAEQIALIQKVGFSSRLMLWSTMFWTVPLLVYLLYVRKFFTRSATEPASVVA